MKRQGTEFYEDRGDVLNSFSILLFFSTRNSLIILTNPMPDDASTQEAICISQRLIIANKNGYFSIFLNLIDRRRFRIS